VREEIKKIILDIPVTRQLARVSILAGRRINRILSRRLGLLDHLFFSLLLVVKKSILVKIIQSDLFKTVMLKDTAVVNYMLAQYGRFATESKNRTFMYSAATLFRFKKEYKKAFELYFALFQKYHFMNYCLKALVCEAFLDDKCLYQYYLSNAEEFPEPVQHLLTCEYAQYYDEIEPDWEAILACLQEDFFTPLVNKSLLAALACKNKEYIDTVRNDLLSVVDASTKEYYRRSITIVAACYYRSGCVAELQQLNQLISYENNDWKLYMQFGAGDIMSAMDYRSKTIKNSFLLYYPQCNKTNDKVLVPEKDLCGEAFNSLYYRDIAEDVGRFTVVCDRRLHKVMTDNFSNIDFVPKEPRYRQNIDKKKFNKLPYNLSNYLDNVSYGKTFGADFFTIDYSRFFSSENCTAGRKQGWLRADADLMAHWQEWLNQVDGIKVGFSPMSTVRSRIRDMHMVSVEHWGDLFAIKGSVFVNLNAALSTADCEKMSAEYGVKIMSPEVDLYNDFDSLLALMSVLDCGVLPANNLMDFAAAVGLKAIVFSPSRIMKVWSVDDDRYVFSENIKFVFPETEIADPRLMVKAGVAELKNL
jgi:hypothetical protein